jgi:hypothetical protein
MDKLVTYRRIIQKIVAHHAQYTPSHGQIETLPICDETHDNYLLMDLGWARTGRVHAVAFHLRLRDGKIWIEWDGTEPGIAQEFKWWRTAAFQSFPLLIMLQRSLIAVPSLRCESRPPPYRRGSRLPYETVAQLSTDLFCRCIPIYR